MNRKISPPKSMSVEVAVKVSGFKLKAVRAKDLTAPPDPSSPVSSQDIPPPR